MVTILFRSTFFIFFILAFNSPIAGQLLYSVVGQYNNKSAQGMAINDYYAYLINDGGGCRVLNLKTRNIDKEFAFECSKYNPHVNNACFGIKTDDYDIPPLYVSEFRKPYRCFVEQININDSKLIQTISLQDEMGIKALNWVVDADQKCLYVIDRNTKALNEKGEMKNTIVKFNLPTINDGEKIVLSNRDCIEKFDVYFSNALQGSKIRGNFLFVVTGFQEMLSYRKEYERAVIVIDLKKKKIKSKIDLRLVTTNEPEDMDFHGNNALLFCGQNGGIYKFNIQY